MASLADILRSFGSKGIRQTFIDSRNAPGGILDRGRWNRASSGALVGDSNIYDPLTDTSVGNTVSNYTAGVPSGNLFAANSRLYRNPGQGSASVAGPTTGGELDSLGSAIEPEVPSYLQLFEGNYYTDPAAYYEAILAALMGEGEKQKGRYREDYGLQKSSLLDQISRLFEDLGREETKGKQNIEGYYGSLGDIYQSSQGVRENEFNQDIARERGRITKSKDESVSALDRQLNEYLSGVDTQVQQGIDSTYGQALSTRGELAPTKQFAYSAPGSVNVQDTSALLKNLEAFLSPKNVQQNRRRGSNTANDVYSYLNPIG